MPELQEIDRLIAGTSPPAATAPEAAGPSVQELDRLIAAIPSGSVPARADLTGAMGAGVEGLQVGEVAPGIAETPKPAPTTPGQAEIMARAPGAQVGVPGAPQEAAPPVQIPATPPPVVTPYEGPLPKLPEVLTGPSVPGQAVAQALQAGAQSVAEGAKNITEGLTGFLTTARQAPGETFPGHKIRAARQVMDGLFNLGLAPFLAAGTGGRELLREVSPGAEAAEIIDPTTSGFVREMLGGSPPERTAEALAALRKPMTLGEVMELALTLGLPALIHGKAPKPAERAAPKPLEAAPPKEEARPAPRPTGPPPEVADVLRRAEEASQRAEAAVRRVEALTAKAEAPPPVEVPPEAARPPVEAPRPPSEAPTAAERAMERARRLEGPPPPGQELPAGRIAEAARPQPEAAAPLRPLAQLQREPGYDQRGTEVVDRRTGQTVARGQSGAEAQLKANQLNAARREGGAFLPRRRPAEGGEEIPPILKELGLTIPAEEGARGPGPGNLGQMADLVETLADLARAGIKDDFKFLADSNGIGADAQRAIWARFGQGAAPLRPLSQLPPEAEAPIPAEVRLLRQLSSYYDASRWLEGGRSAWERYLGRETRVERDRVSDDIHVRLYNTRIVTYHADGRITLRTGHYDTRTTWDRINQLLPGGWSVWSDRGRRFLYFNGVSREPFHEGITFDPENPPPPLNRRAVLAAERAAERRAIEGPEQQQRLFQPPEEGAAPLRPLREVPPEPEPPGVPAESRPLPPLNTWEAMRDWLLQTRRTPQATREAIGMTPERFGGLSRRIVRDVDLVAPLGGESSIEVRWHNRKVLTRFPDGRIRIKAMEPGAGGGRQSRWQQIVNAFMPEGFGIGTEGEHGTPGFYIYRWDPQGTRWIRAADFHDGIEFRPEELRNARFRLGTAGRPAIVEREAQARLFGPEPPRALPAPGEGAAPLRPLRELPPEAEGAAPAEMPRRRPPLPENPTAVDLAVKLADLGISDNALVRLAAGTATDYEIRGIPVPLRRQMAEMNPADVRSAAEMLRAPGGIALPWRAEGRAFTAREFERAFKESNHGVNEGEVEGYGRAWWSPVMITLEEPPDWVRTAVTAAARIQFGADQVPRIIASGSAAASRVEPIAEVIRPDAEIHKRKLAVFRNEAGNLSAAVEPAVRHFLSTWPDAQFRQANPETPFFVWSGGRVRGVLAPFRIGAEDIPPGLREPVKPSGEAFPRPFPTPAGEAVAKPEPPVAPPFYSRLQKAVEQKMPIRAPAQQILAIAKGQGISPDEVLWTGFDLHLEKNQGKVFSKQEILDWLRANAVQIKQVVKGAPIEAPRPSVSRSEAQAKARWWGDQLLARRADVEFEMPGGEGGKRAQAALMLAWNEGLRGGEAAKAAFDSLGRVLPEGGQELAESLRTAIEEYRKAQEVLGSTEVEQRAHTAEADTRWGSHVLPGSRGGYRETLYIFDPSTRPEVRSRAAERLELGNYPTKWKFTTHWAEDNVLAWDRSTDRVDTQGRKLLLLEELQSDWLKTLRGEGGAPPAPLADTWYEYVMKAALRRAAEGGYDGLAWTTGRQQSVRWRGLEQIAGDLQWRRLQDGRYEVEVPGFGPSQFGPLTPSRLADLVGDGIASEITDSPGTSGRHRGGVKLTQQGKFHLYDVALPGFMAKYLKRWDATVASSTIPDVGYGGGNDRVHFVPITEKMRESVLQEGQPALLRPLESQPSQPGSILPAEIGAFLRTPEGRGKAGFDPRIVNVLGQNLYSGPLDMIAVKEMVQNAVDALRSKGGGRVEVGYDAEKRTVWVADDGPGMSPDMATSELLDIGGSRKEAGATGGFGIAKVAIFANAERIVADTRWRDPETGKVMMTQLSGSAQDWMGEGLTVKTVEGPPGTPTGTDIQVTLKPDARLDRYSTGAWMQNFLNDQRLEGYDLDFTLDGRPLKRVEAASVKIGDLELPGAPAEVYAVGGTAGQATFARISVLNNGLYQFNTTVYFPDKVPVPVRIVLDVKAGSPDAPDYPFRPDREGLKGPAMDALEQFMQGRFVGDYAARANRRYREAWEGASTLPSGLRYVDTTGGDFRDFVQQTLAAPYLEPLGRELSAALPALSESVGRVLGERFADIGFAGYGTGPTYLAVNIRGQMIGQPKNQILMNPWLNAKEVADLMQERGLPESEAPTLLAEWMLQSALHEVAHQGHRGHGESFSGYLTRAIGPGRRAFNEAVDRVQSVLEADNHALATQLLADAARYDQVPRGSGEDIFGSAGAGLAAAPERGGGEGGPPPGEERRPRLAGPVRPGGENPPEGVVPGAGPERGRPGAPGLRGPAPGVPPARPGLVDAYGRPAGPVGGVEAAGAGEVPPPPPPPEPKSPFARPPTPPEGGVPPEGPPPLEEPRLRLEHHKAVVDAAGEMFERAGIARDKDRWPILSDQILDAMREGTLDLPTMQETLQGHGLSLVEFGESMFRPAVKNAAQRLQILSALQRRLNRLAVEAGRGTEADALLTLAQQVETLRREGGDEAPLTELSWWRRADNVRRGLLVTQLATAIRNLETQLARLPIDALDQALQRTFGGKEADPWAAWESFTEALSQIRPTKGGAAARKASQGQIENLLQAFPKEWDRLFGTYSADIARQAREGGAALKGADAVLSGAEKLVNTLNFFNRFQEFAVRRSVFWSDLGSRLERRGIDAEALAKGERRLSAEEWDTIGPDVKASVQKALEMTFAQNAPYGSLGWHFIQGVNKLPLILSGPLPFPRFMVNSLKFLYDFSPLPFLKLMSSAERAKVAAGDTKLLSRASLGTAALLGAWLIREAQPDENKWYEMTVPGGATVDIRPFNPFAAYFFLGDLAKRVRTNTLYRTDWKDITRGVASANVSGGLGLFALDKIIAGLGELGKPGKTVEALSQAGGEVLSGLLVPLRTLTDLYAQFDPEWQVVRERRAEPLLGPAKAQFGMGEPQYLPTRAEPLKREQPLLRQATGITKVSEKNDLEQELDRLQFSRQEVQGRSTGDPVADNLVAKHMGELAETQTLPKLAGFPYQGLSDPRRMEWLRVELGRIRAIATARAKRDEPQLFKEVEAGRVPARRRLLNEERAGQGLAPLRGR